MKTLSLTLPAQEEQTIPMHLGPGVLKDFSGLVDLSKYEGIALLFDEGLRSIAEGLAAHLDNSVLVPVESGEESKSLTEVDRIVSTMLDEGISRKSLLIVIGGGMMTDLGGFVASIYMRGISFVQVPTSLLGMVDASVGGKTGVNAGDAKNIIGTFKHPEAIVIDTDVLSTLPNEKFNEGMVEVVKMAAILSEEDFVWIEENIDALLDRTHAIEEECVERALRMKMAVVSADEKESGKRMLLNLGHTIGHSVEAASDYVLSHGKAVSIGREAEMTIGEFSEKDRVTALLRKLDMPLAIPESNTPEELWELMLSDKKTVGDDVKMSVPTVLGSGEVRSLSKDEFIAYMSQNV